MSEKKSGKKSIESGANGFSEAYWQENYDEPEEMDGIVNATHHALYLKSFFAVEFVDVSSVIDFGFGLGHLYEAILKEFMPYKSWGLEPSKFAFDKVKERNISPCDSTQLSLKNWSIEKWTNHAKDKNQKWFDLGICTSVFQYLDEESLQTILPEMSKRVKYLYFSVPTDFELKRQVKELEFKDRFAFRRSKSFYLKLLKPHFTVIGNRVLESKHHFNEDNTFFTDYLFRK
ncbi:MAG: class I SAM-dependent methyltransferase [Halobacteriovoraceae bacterium]|nr:class I SAM-dependent methyltransferase [Halobacteriovoraceae bacterium]